MPVKYRFRTITSAGGDLVHLPRSGVTCIVGGNNAGKSQLLRDLRNVATNATQDRVLVVLGEAQADIQCPTDVQEAQTWLNNNAFPGTGQERNQPYRFAAVPGDWGLTANDFVSFFAGAMEFEQAAVGQASEYLLRLATAGRLADYAAGEMLHQSGPRRENWTLEKIYASGAVGKSIEELTTEAFGVPVILDRANVPTRFRVGDPEVEVPPLDNPSEEYREALADLPDLDSQGDGLRSFVGLAALLLAMRPEVALLDEPEAFLHPGQARAVGRWLARVAVELDIQVVIATHDRDILLGLMSDGTHQPNVVRVSRDFESGFARFHQLPEEDLRLLWDDPVLKYSNVLQGLFHRRVVICEGDGDCRFFAAALDAAARPGKERAAAEDTLFVPSGGKDRSATLAKSLSRLGVSTAAILDFDALNRKKVVRDVLEGVGGTWDDQLETLYRSITDTANGTPGLWDLLKSAGVNAFPSGDSFSALSELLEVLESQGVLILRHGEMEDLNKHIKPDGSDWVTEALAAGTHAEELTMQIVRPLLT